MSGYKDLESGNPMSSGFKGEVFGTFFLSLALFAGTDGWGALAAGGMLAFLAWFGLGQDLNGAVTVNNIMNKSASPKAGVFAIVAQIVGALLATLFAGFLAGGAPGAPSGGSTGSALTDIFLTWIVLWTAGGSAENKGFGYYAGLRAFSSTFGANASVVLGVVFGNAALGGGLAFGNGVIYAAGAPLLAGALFNFLPLVLDKIPKSSELFGSFLFALMTFSIGLDNPFAVALALHTVSNTGFAGNYNPIHDFAAWSKGGFNMAVIADPVIALVVQSVGVVLAVIVGSFIGVSASLPAASGIGPSGLLEVLFTIVLVNGSGGDSFSKGFSYFGALSTYASSFNPAFALGTFLAGLAGFGGAGLAVNSIAFPLVGAILAGFLSGKFSEFNGIIGGIFFFLVVGSGVSNFALAAQVTAINGAYGETNPIFNAKDTKAVGFQIAGATVGALLANWAGVAGGAAVSAGLPGDINGAVAEFLLAAFVVKAGYGGFGLNYFAFLSVFGASAGSIANPATTLGGFIGGGILGGGFDFGGIVGVLGHVAIPLVAGLFGAQFFDIVPGKLQLDKAQLDANEFFGSFLIVLAAAAAGGAGPNATFAFGIIFTVVNSQYAGDLFPAISAQKLLDGDAVGFAKKLVAQTLGALVALYTSGFFGARRMLQDGAAAAAPAAAAGPGLSDTLRNGILLGMVLSWGWSNSSGTWGKTITYFVASTLFGSVAFNGAASLAGAVQGAIGGDTSSLADAGFWAAFLAPVIGAAIAGKVGAFLK